MSHGICEEFKSWFAYKNKDTRFRSKKKWFHFRCVASVKTTITAEKDIGPKDIFKLTIAVFLKRKVLDSWVLLLLTPVKPGVSLKTIFGVSKGDETKLLIYKPKR